MIRSLSIVGDAAGVTLRPNVSGTDGRALPVTDRWGSTWLGTVAVTIEGHRDNGVAYLTLHPAHARELAAKLERHATFAEARAKGEAGPCLCTAWSHNLYPCPNDAALDYSACRECWTPETGTQHLTMGHGEPDRV